MMYPYTYKRLIAESWNAGGDDLIAIFGRFGYSKFGEIGGFSGAGQ
jgi:hypothetical protein